MGTFIDPPGPGIARRHSTRHNQLKWYTVSYANEDRAKLKRYVIEQANGLWHVEVQHYIAPSSRWSGKGVDVALVRYGPAHGNSPSDVNRLFDNANVALFDTVKQEGEARHVKDGCRHVNCAE